MYEIYCEKAGLTEHKDFVRWVDGKKFIQKCRYNQDRKCGANCVCFDIGRLRAIKVSIGCSDLQYVIDKENFIEDIKGLI